MKCLLPVGGVCPPTGPTCKGSLSLTLAQNLLCFSVTCLVVSDVAGLGLGKTPGTER